MCNLFQTIDINFYRIMRRLDSLYSIYKPVYLLCVLQDTFFSARSSFKIVFNVKTNSYNSCVLKRCLQKIKIGSYFVECTVNVMFKSKEEGK
jgi:hypothetical protein